MISREALYPPIRALKSDSTWEIGLTQFQSIDKLFLNSQSAHTQFRGPKLLFDLETLCVLSIIYIDFTRKKKLVHISKSQ